MSERTSASAPSLLILNQMAGPMTWELAEDLGASLGRVAVLTGHPDTLAKGSSDQVELTAVAPYRRGNFVVRFWCWIRYCTQAFFWVFRFPPSTPILAMSNPPMVVWVCRLVHIMRGTQYAVMVHDIYPDAIVNMGYARPGNPIIWAWRALNRIAYQRAKVVMALGRHMKNNLDEQFNATKTAAGEVLVIPPWADTQRLARIKKADNWFAKKYNQVDRLTIMYSGNMGQGHDIESLLAAADKLRSDESIQFMFIGAGPKWSLVQEFLEKRSPGVENVTLLPWQDESVIPFSLATADLSVVSLESEFSGLAVPSKAYYFIASGAPLLALCEKNCELADTIDEFKCGIAVKPGDVDSLVNAIQRLRSTPQLLTDWRAGALRASAHHSRSKNTTEFLEILEQFEVVEPVKQGSVALSK